MIFSGHLNRFQMSIRWRYYDTTLTCRNVATCYNVATIKKVFHHFIFSNPSLVILKYCKYRKFKKYRCMFHLFRNIPLTQHSRFILKTDLKLRDEFLWNQFWSNLWYFHVIESDFKWASGCDIITRPWRVVMSPRVKMSPKSKC